MTSSKYLKGLLAGFATVALIGTAMAQGSPPNPAVKSAPVGAGQQSSQQTPMGTTGTPTAGPMVTGSGTTTGSTSTGTASTAGTTSGSTATGSSMPVARSTAGGNNRPVRKVRADRN